MQQGSFRLFITASPKKVVFDPGVVRSTRMSHKSPLTDIKAIQYSVQI